MLAGIDGFNKFLYHCEIAVGFDVVVVIIESQL